MSTKDYLLSIKEEEIFLIISGIDGDRLVDTIHHLPTINSIYIFCFEKQLHEQWVKNYKRICGVYDNKDELLKVLKEDIRRCLFKILPIRALDCRAMQKSIKELNEDGGLFIWSHF
ncbi:unnamed protein product [Rotaria sp. Silwood1]|nr:unnamed protein product [Rotaria sp. Silwood1]CAF1653671.1 unnamed protein product [Rotaria sp. Silwood1]CAF3898478.1 unnamed protein product [Rotaria sp. Silwood1]CAF3913259.1 unnamed protein product [Rotaria sp. Silwood1]CAF4970419.1 unnamed protein product [Rotaria sp. Silwood1]